MFTVVNHRLDDTAASKNVVWDPTANHNGAITPMFLVFHYTGCKYEVARTTFKRTTGENRTSAHLLVDSDGSVTQLVDFNRRAWHAGESFWDGLQDINTHSIGIEVVNYGYLLKTATSSFKLSNGEAAPFQAEDVVEVRHKFPSVSYAYWHSFTPEQIETCGELSELLINHYGLKEILGHDDIAPTRKVDPGPAFPLNRMRNRAFGRNAEVISEEVVDVSVPKLNIRTGPGVEYPLAGSPLLQHTKLCVLARHASWVQVQLASSNQLRGWVFSEHTRPTRK